MSPLTIILSPKTIILSPITNFILDLTIMGSKNTNMGANVGHAHGYLMFMGATTLQKIF